jgi:hypothetical protein
MRHKNTHPFTFKFFFHHPPFLNVAMGLRKSLDEVFDQRKETRKIMLVFVPTKQGERFVEPLAYTFKLFF